jgi:hypothetical protein
MSSRKRPGISGISAHIRFGELAFETAIPSGECGFNETNIVGLEAGEPDSLSVLRLRLPLSPPCRSARSREKIDQSTVHQAAPPKARLSKPDGCHAGTRTDRTLCAGNDARRIGNEARWRSRVLRPPPHWPRQTTVLLLEIRSIVVNADDVLQRLIAQDQRTHEE